MKDPARLFQACRRSLLVGCIVLWTGAFVATHIPNLDLGDDLPSDKTLHFWGYLVLSAVFLATMVGFAVNRRKRVIAGICTMTLYAAADELTQLLVNRSAAWGDWIADVAGALAAFILMEVLLALLGRRSS